MALSQLPIGSSATLRDFANATRRVLAGDKGPLVTQGLPPELAEVLTALMAALDGNKLN